MLRLLVTILAYLVFEDESAGLACVMACTRHCHQRPTSNVTSSSAGYEGATSLLTKGLDAARGHGGGRDARTRPHEGSRENAN